VLDDLPDERELKALYMLRPPRAASRPSLPPSFDVRAVPNERLQIVRAIVELDGPLSDPAWQSVSDAILPDGLFIARECVSDRPVGTASAVHNPRGGRFFFPGGGELGYLVVAPAFRGRGLGAALVAAVVHRFETAGYRHVWVGVQGWRLPAIRTYLAAGFKPFLHAPEPAVLEARWRRIFARLGREVDTTQWPRRLFDDATWPISSVPFRLSGHPDSGR
jgi:GNAT superfamily N-acetyltransferase